MTLKELRKVARLHDGVVEFPDDAMTALIVKKMREPHGPSVILKITPAVASFVIGEFNTGNRPKKPAKILEYAGYMAAGDWKLTGDTIKFSTLYLRDGQNRLMACIRANVPFVTHVVFGLDDTVFPWLDRTKTRGNSDVMHIAGIPNSADVSGAVRWLEMFRLDRVKDRMSLTPQETLDAYKEHYDASLIEASISAARRIYAADRTPRTLSAPLYYMFAKKNRELADDFFEAWETRNYSGRMKPLKKAAAQLSNLYTASNGRVHEVVRLAVWIVAWNLMIDRRTGTAPDFRWKPDAAFPRIKG